MSAATEDLEATLGELKRSSKWSLVMALLGAGLLIGSVIFSATRLAPLERKITALKAEITAQKREIAELGDIKQGVKEQIEEARQEYRKLRGNIEQLYAVRVAQGNEVYELRATARATGDSTQNGPGYIFTIFVNAPEATLRRIQEVRYTFDHPSFQEKNRSSMDASNHFETGYYGWGCLSNVDVVLLFDEGESQSLDFNMCQSLGLGWWSDEGLDGVIVADEGIVKKLRHR